MPDTTNPWAIDFNQFKAATDPYLKDGNFWSDENGKLDSGPQLQLANGKTWRPSGWQSGITYHPKGEVTYETSFDGNGGEGGNQVSTPKTNEEEYWEVRGDLSEMTGQAGSEKHVGIKYKKEGDKLVPIEDPLFRDYTTKYGTINRGLIAIAGAGLAANAGLLGNLGSTGMSNGAFLGEAAWTPTAAAGDAFIPAANSFTSGALGSGTFDAGLGDVLSTSITPTVGQGAPLALAPTAGTGALGAGLGGAATDAMGAIIGTGTAAEGAAAIGGGGILSTIASAIKSPLTYITTALGLQDNELVKDLKDVLSITGGGKDGSSLFDHLMKGLQGGANNEAALEKQRLDNQGRIDVANINATNNLDILKLKDQQTQDANKRFSASVSGLNYGLINSAPKPLTRNDGTRVFSGNGLINRG